MPRNVHKVLSATQLVSQALRKSKSSRCTSEDNLSHYDPKVEELTKEVVQEVLKEVNTGSMNAVKGVVQIILDITVMITHVALLHHIRTKPSATPFFWFLVVALCITICVQVIAGFFIVLLIIGDYNASFRETIERWLGAKPGCGFCPLLGCWLKDGTCRCNVKKWNLNHINNLVVMLLLFISIMDVAIVVMAEF